LTGAPSSLPPTIATHRSSLFSRPSGLPLVAALLASLPVFLQAPWVRTAPFSAALFSAVLLAAGLGLERWGDQGRRQLGGVLVGFSGSWLGGALFWGWFRLHPVCHLPIEAFALPLALGGLKLERWRLAASFYLASLLGTACTDAAIANLGLMDLWPAVLEAPQPLASQLLHQAGESVLQPLHLSVFASYAAALWLTARQLNPRGLAGRLAAATLLTTLAVDGLFLLAALLAPRLSGLI
jgi:hypothetical protein